MSNADRTGCLNARVMGNMPEVGGWIRREFHNLLSNAVHHVYSSDSSFLLAVVTYSCVRDLAMIRVGFGGEKRGAEVPAAVHARGFAGQQKLPASSLHYDAYVSM